MIVYTAIYCRKKFDAINYVTYCWMTCGFLRLATLQFDTKLLRDNHIKIFHLERYIAGYTAGNHVLRLRSRVAVKLNFRPYIRRHTSSNKNFEYGYPLSVCTKKYAQIKLYVIRTCLKKLSFHAEYEDKQYQIMALFKSKFFFSS